MKEATRTFTLPFYNQEKDLLAALDIVDRKKQAGGRKITRLMVLGFVMFYAISMIASNPSFMAGWAIFVLSILLTVVVLREPHAGNKRFAKSYSEDTPHCTAEVNEEGIFLIDDASGKKASFHYDAGIAVFAQDKVYAISAAKQKFGMFLAQALHEEEQTELDLFLQEKLQNRFERIEPSACPKSQFRR